MSGVLALESAPFLFAGEWNAALSALLWGSAHVIIARIHPPLSAPALNLGKNVSATVFFVGALWIVSGSPVPSGMDGPTLTIFALSGFLGLALCDTLLIRSLLDIGPQRMSLMLLAVPVLVALAATLPPLSESPPWPAWLGMVVCLGGISIAVLRKAPPDTDPERFKRGVRAALLATLFQTAAILLARHGLANGDAPVLDSGVVRLAAGALGVVLLGAFSRKLPTWAGELKAPRPAVMLTIAAFFGTFIGILTNQYGLKWATHAGVATTLNSLMPIYLLPLSVIFLGQRFDRRDIIATLVSVGGVALMFMAS
jgi:drug/metabolite transporter (DMT)-like permease